MYVYSITYMEFIIHIPAPAAPPIDFVSMESS